METAAAISLSVSWTAPDNTGKLASTDYDVRYRKGTSGSWTDHAHDGIDTSTTITGLTANARHQVQVRARNAEGTGAWSNGGTESTNAIAYFYPTSGDRVSGGVVRSGSEGCDDDDWIWSCLGEAEPDGDASMITLALAGAVRLGFTVESGDVTGTVIDVRFEVNMAASSGTMEPDTYSFKAYADDSATPVATMDGPATVGTDYMDVTVYDRVFGTAADTTITDGLSGNLDDAELEIQAPAKPYLQLTRVRMVVEYQPDDK